MKLLRFEQKRFVYILNLRHALPLTMQSNKAIFYRNMLDEYKECKEQDLASTTGAKKSDAA